MTEEKTRQEEIHDKGFSFSGLSNYGSIKLKRQEYIDAVLSLGSLKDANKTLADKTKILKAIADKDYVTMRQISDYYYRIDGIYQKTCNAYANMYRYDWWLVPENYKNTSSNKIIKEFAQVLSYLDNSSIKKMCAEFALSVIKKGVYYGYAIDSKNGMFMQELPITYCRSRFSSEGLPVVEFNMKFFDDHFKNETQRKGILKMFPTEFQLGYALYRSKRLVDETGKEGDSWYPLELGRAIKFALPNEEIPFFINSIPAILDLNAAQELDRKRQMQKLVKILVQKLPMDKNGDLIFDIEEAKDIHANALQMLSSGVGLDVLTTFTDIDAIDLSDTAANAATDELERCERAVFNAMGVSQNLFNTSGNLSLEKSVLTDEGTLRPLITQFNLFFDRLIQKTGLKPKGYNFRFYMLETTQYNYKELAKTYKELISNGYPKTLPMIALGHSQSSVLNTLHFENEILNLSELMIPPLSSNTLNSEDILDKTGQTANNKTDTQKQGRPEKPDDQKSEKTLQNQESLS